MNGKSHFFSKLLLVWTVLVLFALARTGHCQAVLDWFTKAYGDGKRHNAFTDLARWKDSYYLCFRHGQSHGSMDGEIRILRSKDLRSWKLCGVLKTLGDDRDPHFTVTADRLYVYFGTWDLTHREGTSLPDRGTVRTYFSSTTDGNHWEPIRGVFKPKWWLWRVRYLNGVFYSAAYTAYRPTPPARETLLLRSNDGVHWEKVGLVTDEKMAGEADFWLEKDGTMALLTRTIENGRLFRSDPTLKRWKMWELDGWVHAPVVAGWKDRYFVAGRDREDGETVTKLWELVGNEIRDLLTLPSGGDTAYAGLVVVPESLDGDVPQFYVSWYSAVDPDAPEKGKRLSSVYVGKITVNP